MDDYIIGKIPSHGNIREGVLNHNNKVLPESKLKTNYEYIQRLQKLKSVNIGDINKASSNIRKKRKDPERKDTVITKLLSNVFRPNTQVHSPAYPHLHEKPVPQKIVQKNRLERRYSPEKSLIEFFRKRSHNRKQRRKLMDHSRFMTRSQVTIKDRFTEIMKNQNNDDLSIINPRSRAGIRNKSKEDTKDLTTNSGGWSALKSREGIFSDKSIRPGLMRKFTGISKTKYTDHMNSRFDVTSHSPTKTDKSLVLMDNVSQSKHTDLQEVHKILEKIEQTEFMNKHPKFKKREAKTPNITIDGKSYRNSRMHPTDKNHPMNLSMSSFNSVKKSKIAPRNHTPQYLSNKQQYIEYWSAKTSKRMKSRQEQKSKRILDIRRCNTKIMVDKLDKLEEETHRDTFN